MIILRRYPLVVALTFLFSAYLLQAEERIELPSFTGNVQKKVIPIAVEAEDTKTKALMQRAFNLHGAFELVVEEDARFIIDFSADGNTGKAVIMSSGRGSELFRTTAEGKHSLEALLRAADKVVNNLTGDPGFFAGQLVFVSDRSKHLEIYRSDILFQKVARVTQHNDSSISPNWSADGSKITYTSYHKSGFPDLFLADLNDRKVSPLATYKGTNTGGSFSPSGWKIAMILSGPGNPELFITDIDGKNAKRLTKNRSLEASPDWSPDSSRVVLTSDRMGSPQLFEVSINGGAMKHLQTNISRYCTEPSWNPRYHEKIAFTASSSKGFQLALLDRSEGAASWLTASGGDNIEPVWANDGRHLFFTQRAGKVQRLHILDTESGKIKALHSTKFGNSSQGDFVYTAR